MKACDLCSGLFPSVSCLRGGPQFLDPTAFEHSTNRLSKVTMIRNVMSHSHGVSLITACIYRQREILEMCLGSLNSTGQAARCETFFVFLFCLNRLIFDVWLTA